MSICYNLSVQFVKSDNTYIIRLEKNESVIDELTKFCEKESINTATFSGIGAVSSATLAFYNLGSKEYEFKTFSQDHEVVSLTGNVSLVENKPFLHIHCVLSNDKFECFGGHLKKGVVGATLEIRLTNLNIKIERELDNDTGLKLLNCSQG